ncbi:antirestriction protein [Klebsiella pneumoniae]
MPAFFLPVPGQSTKEVAAGSALPGHAGHGLVGFQLCGLSVVCGLCRASIVAGLAGMQGYASPLRSPGPSFPSAVIFRSFTRSDFAVSPSNSRQPCASGFYGGTAPPGVAEYVNNGGKHHAICETCHSER